MSTARLPAAHLMMNFLQESHRKLKDKMEDVGFEKELATHMADESRSDVRPLTIEDFSEEARFDCPVQVDALLAQLGMHADARKACLDSASREGALSLQDLQSILGRVNGGGEDGFKALGQVDGQSVRELLENLKVPVASKEGLGEVRIEASYDLPGVRELLSSLVDNLAARGPSGERQTGLGIEVPVADGTSTPAPSAASLLGKAVPSFVGFDDGQEGEGGLFSSMEQKGRLVAGDESRGNSGHSERVATSLFKNFSGVSPLTQSAEPSVETAVPSSVGFDDGQEGEGGLFSSMEQKGRLVAGDESRGNSGHIERVDSSPFKDSGGGGASTSDHSGRGFGGQSSFSGEEKNDTGFFSLESPASVSFSAGGDGGLSGQPSAQTAAFMTAANTGNIERWLDAASQMRKNFLKLEMDDKNLGKLILEVRTQQKEVSAKLTTETEQARGLLLQNTAALRQELQAEGMVLEQFQVDVEGRGSGRGNREREGGVEVGKNTAATSKRKTTGSSGRSTANRVDGEHSDGISLFA